MPRGGARHQGATANEVHEYMKSLPGSARVNSSFYK
jgi:hypothetical protein